MRDAIDYVFKMDEMCIACLSTGRNLRCIVETGFYELYTQLLNEIPVCEAGVSGMAGGSGALVCWQCRAALRRARAFRDAARTARAAMLAWRLQSTAKPPPPPNPPSLRIEHVVNLSYPPAECPPVKSEFGYDVGVGYGVGCDVGDGYDVGRDVGYDVGADVLGTSVKSEADETHREPEAFVYDLRGDEVGGNGKGKGKAPKEKKKKSKVKNKIKVKKKTKTNPDGAPRGDANDVECENYYDGEETALVEKLENKCGECGEGFGSQGELDAHVATLHAEEKPRKVKRVPTKRDAAEAPGERPTCAECGKVFSSRKTYRYHLNVLHRGQNAHPCPRCGKVYQWKSNLGRHLRTHKARETGELYCAVCDKRFASVATLRQHQRGSRSHVAEAEFSFICECGKKFVNKTRLRDHVDWEHLNKVKFRCQLCHKPFKCHTSLYVHTQNVHRDKEKKDNLCHVCGKSYQNSAKLKYHIVAMHTHETPYRCAECSAAFGWYSSLYRHVREVHLKMKLQSNKKGRKSKKLPPESLPAPPLFPPVPPLPALPALLAMPP